jgi:hypothetical protein
LKTTEQHEQSADAPEFVPVQVILTKELRRNLNAEARRRAINRSVLIREACQKMLGEEDARAVARA